MTLKAYVGADIFDGVTLHSARALLADGDRVVDLVPAADVPDGCELERVDGGTILPGFVDLQVNGGGGVMFNDETTPAAVAAIAAAHASTGTRAILPTLITDTRARTRAAIDAVETAIASGVPGILGVHLEGPHLSLARKGAHDPALIRPMDREDEAVLMSAVERLPNVLVTVAPENVTAEQIARLTQAGLVVSLGHTDCGFTQAQEAFGAGATCATHLFNAMSQLGNREPGLVGAVLQSGSVFAGLIADGIHVHPASIRTALDAKKGPGKVFLVTDAMSTVGSDITEFRLNGRRVLRRDGRLTLADGTLAGADLDMPTALLLMQAEVGVTPQEAMSMATSVPASVLRNAQGFGRLSRGAPLHAIRLGPDGRIDPEFLPR